MEKELDNALLVIGFRLYILWQVAFFPILYHLCSIKIVQFLGELRNSRRSEMKVYNGAHFNASL